MDESPMLKESRIRGPYTPPEASPEGRSWLRRRVDAVGDWWVNRAAFDPKERGTEASGSSIGALEDLTLLNMIGKGGFGHVCLAEVPSEGNRKVAVKVTPKTEARQAARARHESALLAMLGHPLIVGFYGELEDDMNCYRVVEFLPGGDLASTMRAMDGGAGIEVARAWASELASAVAFMHSRGVLYRDMKPQNVLLDREGHLRVCDFDLARDGIFEPLKGAKTFCGTLQYMAPEVVARSSAYGLAVDWYGIGAVILEAITGLPPFYSSDRNIMATAILTQDLKLSPAQVPDEAARDLLARLLHREPRMRLGASDRGAAAVMRHPFFNGVNWTAVSRARGPVPYVPPSIDGGLNVDERVLKMALPDTPAARGM